MATVHSSKLSFHKGSGQFCKSVCGKRYYLGKDHDQALETWLRYKSDFEAGIDPRKTASRKVNRLTLKDGCNRFLRAKENEIKPRSLENLVGACRMLVKFFGEQYAIENLTPDHFIRLKAHFNNGNPVTLSNRVQNTRTLFKWLAENKLIEPVDFGSQFKKPGKKEMRRHRYENPVATLAPSEVLDSINYLGIHYRACGLLAINCGFLSADCRELPDRVVDLDAGVIDWIRPKTEMLRKSPLWDETCEALELSRRYRKHVGDTFFQITNRNDIQRHFKAALTSSKAMRSGMSFKSLRKTFASVGREINDDAAVRVIMGHSDDTVLDAHYTAKFPLDRLRAVTDHVRNWVFG